MEESVKFDDRRCPYCSKITEHKVKNFNNGNDAYKVCSECNELIKIMVEDF